jgi:hypothetical protein
VLAEQVGVACTKDQSLSNFLTVPDYWKGLATSTRFAEKSLEACLFAIHIDIIVVWNIYDLHMVCLFVIARFFSDDNTAFA